MSAWLTVTDQDAEISTIWDSAIADLPDEPFRLALSVAHAGYLLSQPNPSAGLELLVKVLVTPGVPPVEADALQVLRTGDSTPMPRKRRGNR